MSNLDKLLKEGTIKGLSQAITNVVEDILKDRLRLNHLVKLRIIAKEVLKLSE